MCVLSLSAEVGALLELEGPEGGSCAPRKLLGMWTHSVGGRGVSTPPSEVSQAALRQLDHALWAPTTARHWHCRPGDIPIYLRFLAIAVVAL